MGNARELKGYLVAAKLPGPLAGIQSSLIYRLSSWRRPRLFLIASSPRTSSRGRRALGLSPTCQPKDVGAKRDTGSLKSSRHRLSFLTVSWFVGRKVLFPLDIPGEWNFRANVAILDKRRYDTITFICCVMSYYWQCSKFSSEKIQEKQVRSNINWCLICTKGAKYSWLNII